MVDLPVHVVVAGSGFVLGLVFGGTALHTNFCTMGAISDIALMGDFRRFRMWLLAIAVAMAGSQGLHLAGIVDLAGSIYLSPSLGWLGAVLGGLLFGFGMMLAGGCGNKTLVRLGAGNLKSLVVALVLGLFAYMTLRGLTGAARVAVIEPANLDLRSIGLSTQGLPDLVAAAAGGSPGLARGILLAGTVSALLWFCLKDQAFRGSFRHVGGAVVIGLLIPAGWIATGVLGRDDFDPVPLASFTFVAPVGESLLYLMIFTGTTINFGVAAVGGVIAGSFVVAVATGAFRLEAFRDTGDMLRHLAGGAMMGTGGVLALGCTIGQGITGLSTLAAGSVLAFLSIVAGGFLGVRYLEEGTLGGALRAMWARS